MADGVLGLLVMFVTGYAAGVLVRRSYRRYRDYEIARRVRAEAFARAQGVPRGRV